MPNGGICSIMEETDQQEEGELQMESKNYTEVIIGGKVYTLAGYEEEAYLQRVASYINEKMSDLKRQQGFLRQSADYQAVMVELNIADDYFRASKEAEAAQNRLALMEKETYNLKHELVGTQIKLEKAQKESEEWQEQLQEADETIARLKKELEEAKGHKK